MKGVIDKTYFQFAKDLGTLTFKEYCHYNKDEVFSIKNYGSYFPAVVNEPEKYIIAQPEMREILGTLRKNGK